MTLPRLLSNFQTQLILHVTFRLTLLLAYLPLSLESAGLTFSGDFPYYYALSAQTDAGLYPFRDWWSEFPPLWSVVQIGVYELLGSSVSFTSFAILLALVMLAFDAGNLWLVRAIGSKIHYRETGIALGWVYSVLAAPLVFAFWTFEPMVMFFLLWGLWLLLNQRDVPSAVVVGFGALTKFVPALLFGAVIRFRHWRKAAIYIITTTAIFAVPYIFLLANPAAHTMTLPSLTAQFNKASYQTVWALIDGNMSTGVFGPVSERADVANATLPRGNPAVVPGIVRLAVAGAIGLFIFLRTRRRDDTAMVAFVLVTLLIFYLQSQGWSPQWLVEILPLTLLCFPNQRGVLICVVLTLLTFAEYPALFVRTGDTGGEIAGGLVLPFAVLVITRTVIMAGMVVALYRMLR
ncbi:MAG: glycosyltransferase 87 family protein, partial [Chloroflexota bacterium]